MLAPGEESRAATSFWRNLNATTSKAMPMPR